MNHLKMHSLNKIDENVSKIAQLFPNCVTEAKDENGEITHKIDFDMLKQELSTSIVEGREERYQFTWPDKKQAILTANAPINKTLRPCREESVNFDTTENLYIECDKLEVLKLLQETYLGKIKMIYIDPPYNTGNDFVYEDDFAQNAGDYIANSGQYDEEGNRLVHNTESNGRFHTDWLNMMYPRLKLARDLLTDDGVIFISIDDNEVENLKKISDEIFGDSNFKTVFSRVTKKGGKSSSEVAKNHDFLLMYVKNQELADLKGIAHIDEGYCKKDEYFEQRGYYKANQTLDYDSLGYVKTLDYPIEIDGEIFYAGGKKEDYENRQKGQHGRADWGWRWSKELFDFGLKNGFIEVHKGGERNRIYTKTYEKVTIDRSNGEYKIVEFDRTKPLSTLEFTENEYSNDNAKKVFDSLMGKGIFEYTKTPEMIKTLQSLVATKDFIVLDFFSGSATTAHAVMQLNSEDGGKRKFIMVQLPELTDEKSEAYKAGYKNICEIGKERIRRAGQLILKQVQNDKEKVTSDLFAKDNKLVKANSGGGTASSVPSSLDIGFRVLKVDSSNMQDVYYSPDDLHKQDLFQDNVKPDRTAEDLLFQVMLDLGVELSSKIETKQINGKTVYYVNENYLVACFDQDITEETITQIAKEKPYYFVMRDSGFANDSVATNFELIFTTYSAGTVRKVL